MKPLYENIAAIWKRCRPEHDCEIRFDEKGQIELRRDSIWFRFDQLSGGEKTVLLILARVLVCAMFSNVDFLMIDEPLEHLDVRNRRSLVNFFVAAANRGLIRQLLVTTFEESLVRKYIDGHDVRTFHLRSV